MWFWIDSWALSVFEKNNPKINDTGIHQSTLQRGLVSESDTDPLNSIVNPQGNPSQYIPPGWAKSNPNISVSHFIDEFPYTGLGTWLQSQQKGTETRIAGIVEFFERLKEERILSLEHSLLVMNNTIQGSQTLFLGLQAE